MMTLNLHELANAPGYGNAEKALRKAGKWKLDPMEKLEQSLNDASGDFDPDHFRQDIDSAATAMEANK
jgi:hypothetical protein